MSHLYESYRKQECLFCHAGFTFIEPVGLDRPRFHRVAQNHILTIERCQALPPDEWWKQRSDSADRVAEEMRRSASCAALDLRHGEEAVATGAVQS